MLSHPEVISTSLNVRLVKQFQSNGGKEDTIQARLGTIYIQSQICDCTEQCYMGNTVMFSDHAGQQHSDACEMLPVKEKKKDQER